MSGYFEACFSKVFGARRGNPKQRLAVKVEKAVRDVIKQRNGQGGVTSRAIEGAVQATADEVATALEQLNDELVVKCDEETGRWYLRLP